MIELLAGPEEYPRDKLRDLNHLGDFCFVFNSKPRAESEDRMAQKPNLVLAEAKSAQKLVSIRKNPYRGWSQV